MMQHSNFWCITLAMCLLTKCLDGAYWNILACPKVCTCGEATSPSLQRSLHTIDCSNARLEVVSQLSKSSITKDNPQKRVILPEFNKNLSSVEQLKLSSNDIELLPQSRFNNLSSLLSLDLSDNKLRELGELDLEGLTGVLSINLTRNCLKLIKPGAFKHTPNLKYLYLTHNFLNYVRPEWFTSIPNLEELLIAQNGIANLKNKTFTALSNLQTLSLADNHLEDLGKDTFVGLNQLQHLDLSGNQLNSIPSRAIALLNNLRDLKLDSNPIQVISAYAFDSLNLYALSLNNIHTLTSIENNAFLSLPLLSNLEISRNPKLVFIAPNAIQDVPKLRKFYLNNNKLTAIPHKLIASLTGLQTLAVQGNPLKCDCNIRWLRKVLEEQDHDIDSGSSIVREDDAIGRIQNQPLSVIRVKDILCSGKQTSPGRTTTSAIHIRGQPLIEIPIQTIQNVCSPTVVPLFSSNYNLELGAMVEMNCHAVGIPIPNIHWILPNGKALNSTSNDVRLKVTGTGTLAISHLKVTDAGTYTCSATSSQGVKTLSTVVNIHSKSVHLMFKGIATNFVTVTWKNTDATIFTSNYVILYRKPGSEETYRKVPIQPYMRAYTFTQLKPQTTYEFCVAYLKSNIPYKIHCSQVTTKHNIYMMTGIKSVHNVTVIVTISVSAISITVICILFAICKNYCRRKEYKDPASWNTTDRHYSTATTYNSKDYYTSQIPMENLYTAPSTSTSVPSTPLCTSTTSLISNVKA